MAGSASFASNSALRVSAASIAASIPSSSRCSLYESFPGLRACFGASAWGGGGDSFFGMDAGAGSFAAANRWLAALRSGTAT